MPIIAVKQKFKIAVENGNQVIEFNEGEHDVSERVAIVAVEHLKVASLKKSGGKNANANVATGQAQTED
ncbi:hypothetical protein ACX1NX_11370 [Acinetobacter sp. ANC 5383]